MSDPAAALDDLAGRLQALGWVRGLLVGGSLASGDHVPGVSDLDLVALVVGPVDPPRRAALRALHTALDRGAAKGQQLGCAWVDEDAVPDLAARHPTWTHGRLATRTLSGVARAELVLHGWAVFGPPPGSVLPPVDEEAVRAAARAELLGWWAEAVRRPWLWLDPAVADLALTSMARGRYALRTGRLLTKSLAVEQADVPEALREALRARRRGEPHARSPRVRTGLLAWRDARRTVALARR